VSDNGEAFCSGDSPGDEGKRKQTTGGDEEDGACASRHGPGDRGDPKLGEGTGKKCHGLGSVLSVVRISRERSALSVMVGFPQ